MGLAEPFGPCIMDALESVRGPAQQRGEPGQTEWGVLARSTSQRRSGTPVHHNVIASLLRGAKAPGV